MLKDEFDPKSININEFEGKFTESAFWSMLNADSKKLGEKIVSDALKLFYCYKSNSTPLLEKSTIAGALGYLIAPYDAIPDSMPVFGLADDQAVLTMALNEVAKYVDDEVVAAAKQRLTLYF